MQVMFLVLFAVSLILFSFFVNQGVQIVPHLLEGSSAPVSLWIWTGIWFGLFLLAFVGTGFFLYERERDEGRIGRRIGLYEWVLNRRARKRRLTDSTPKTIRRA